MLLTTLIGLLPLSSDGLGAFGIGRVLWKQVATIFVGGDSLSLVTCIPAHKGVPWLFLSTFAEGPPAASPSCFLCQIVFLLTMRCHKS